MRRKQQPYHTSRVGHLLRKPLIFLEAAVISFGILGGASFSDDAHGTKEMIKKEAAELPFLADSEEITQSEAADGTEETAAPEKKTESGTTPEFSWENYRIIAHAMGELDGYTYLNSRESFLAYYEQGCRLFEVDLTRTSDGVWVCRHSWNDPMGQWEEEGKKTLTAEEFLSAPLYGKYTPMSLKDLFLLLKDYPDAFVLLDSKQYSVRNYQKTLEDYSEYLEIAREAGAEQVLGQLIPEIYNEAMFPGTALMYKFPSYIYSLWQKYSAEELETIADFCKEKGIPAVTIYEQYWTEEIQGIFDRQGILVYIYTVNDLNKANEYLNAGVAGICTDRILQEQLLG
ncbi:MAG: phosphatidylinositol-specific phospholipase C/glycerophosphodiester phosphodiesterase family protein [Eubacteriales bacterium]|nr:phosphatidylinositol-specific phospholipase C/glycerophosphodiester phosphodiesterase family protein [Eubacteriales bacterium]